MGERDGWQLAGDSADAYERYLVPAIFAAMAERLLDVAGVGKGERVLDVGCGTGIVARRAAARVGARGRVAGLDLNEGMLRVARRAGAGLTPAVDWRQGDAAALPFADGSFDLVTCQQVLQFVGERSAALRELRRVLAPGGRAAIAVLRPLAHAPVYGLVADALARHAGPAAGAMMRSPFPSWDREELRALVASGGFRDVRVRVESVAVRYPSPADLLRQEAASSPLAGSLATTAPDVRDALTRDVEAALRPFTDDDGVAFPLETFVAIART
jgi:ubiquinone/menaquinone biosynthesis C-methylase UbiE